MCTELYSNDLHLKFSDLTTVGIDSVLIAGFLRLGTVEIWGQDIVCERAVPCSVRCLLAFLVYTNDIPAAPPPPPLLQTTDVSIITTCPPGRGMWAQLSPVQNQFYFKVLSLHFYFY